jgi:hypothetical protein
MFGILGMEGKDIRRAVHQVNDLGGAVSNTAPEFGTALDNSDVQWLRGCIQQLDCGQRPGKAAADDRYGMTVGMVNAHGLSCLRMLLRRSMNTGWWWRSPPA